MMIVVISFGCHRFVLVARAAKINAIDVPGKILKLFLKNKIILDQYHSPSSLSSSLCHHFGNHCHLEKMQVTWLGFWIRENVVTKQRPIPIWNINFLFVFSLSISTASLHQDCVGEFSARAFDNRSLVELDEDSGREDRDHQTWKERLQEIAFIV